MKNAFNKPEFNPKNENNQISQTMKIKKLLLLLVFASSLLLIPEANGQTKVHEKNVNKVNAGDITNASANGLAIDPKKNG